MERVKGQLRRPETNYLYKPEALHLAPPSKIISDMRKHGLSKKHTKDAQIWRTVAISFHKKWNGDPRAFLEDSKWDSLLILERLKNDKHIYNGKAVPDFPYLRGNKIGPLWLRMLRDNWGSAN
jgi:hypothetical protein